MFNSRHIEKLVAVASFVAAVILAFYSVYISQYHNVIAETSMLVAQFLLLTASIFGIDYKLNNYGQTEHTARPQK